MEPRFLFFTGEPAATLPLLKQRPAWAPVLSAITFGSWIKNSPGASFEAWEPGDAIVEHARRAARLFGLEIAGVDYVVDAGGFHFIELNPFPRVGLSKESAAAAREMFRGAMDAIEARC